MSKSPKLSAAKNHPIEKVRKSRPVPKQEVPVSSAHGKVQTGSSKTEFFQVISPDGKANSSDPRLPKETLLSAYRTMLLTRILDGKLISLQRQGRIGTYVSCSGQEASQIGSGMALTEKDWLFPMYRDLGMIIQVGVPLDTLLNRIFGNAQDDGLGRDLPNLFGWRRYRVVSFAAPIASHVPMAVGFAMGAKIKKDNLVTLSTFGDGATSSSEFHVSMNFAGVFRVATVFVCENNQYAISLPVSGQTASESIAIKAEAYGFEGVRVDGNDLLAVYTSVRDAVERARRGEGPTLVECETYRVSAHSTSDDWKRYRSSEEVEHWIKRDPIARFRLYLVNERKMLSVEEDAKLKAEIESSLNQAISRAESIPPPPVRTLFEDVYAEVPWHLREQLDQLGEL